MKNINQKELELRKWALEISLKHGNNLYPQDKRKKPSEILSNAKRIINLVEENWDKPIDDCIDAQFDCPILESHP